MPETLTSTPIPATPLAAHLHRFAKDGLSRPFSDADEYEIKPPNIGTLTELWLIVTYA